MSKHNELGVKGEILALDFLTKKEYAILEINWRFEKTEVDIIARRLNTLVIVEVKTRTGNQFGFPEEAVGIEKQKNLAIAAEEKSRPGGSECDRVPKSGVGELVL